MKRVTHILFVAILASLVSQAAETKKKSTRQAASNTSFERRFSDDLKQTPDSKARQGLWFRDAKFGAFIHFGVHSTLEGEYKGRGSQHRYSEWIQISGKMSADEYHQVAAGFNPSKFSADQWVKVFKDADTDYNLYYSTVDPSLGRTMLAKRQGDGVDIHSKAVDPLFVDPEKGDFRFRANSPALEMGIVPIDLSKVGLRISALGMLESDQDVQEVVVAHSTLKGIGMEQGVMRRDPSDVIKVGDLYYVWYSKGRISPGYDATVWYATSPDGYDWTEKGMALAKGEPGSWEGASVFTPNILVAEGKYWLFYTGVSKEYKRSYNPDSKIGIAVSDSPGGPWERLATNPALKNSDNPDDFDSHLVDDACLIVREGKYWFYYKGRQLGKSPAQTQMGLAIADHPQGPYVKHEANPVIPGNHEVLVWPQGTGVAAMIGTSGPKDITNTIQYAQDGVHFVKTHDVKNGPWAGGTYRSEAFTQSGTGDIPQWGVEIGRAKGKLPFIQRFDVKEVK